MVIWSVANQKGGVGKTTTAVSLGGNCAQQGLRTLLVDLDPHGSMSAYFGYLADAIEESAYNLFQQDYINRNLVQRLVKKTEFDNLYVLPASPALATLDRQLGAKGGKGLVVTHSLNEVAVDYDQVIIDCAPMLGVLMVNALAACQMLLIPVQTEFLAIKGTEKMLKTLHMIESAKGLRVPYLIVPTMYDRRTRASKESLVALQNAYETSMSRTVVPVDTNFREASRAGIPINHFLPNTHGAVAYRQLLTEIEHCGRAVHQGVAS